MLQFFALHATAGSVPSVGVCWFVYFRGLKKEGELGRLISVGRAH